MQEKQTRLIDGAENYCCECGANTAYLSISEAAAILGTDDSRAERFIKAGSIHYGYSREGDLRVCFPALLRKQNLLRITHELVAKHRETISERTGG
jgi:hypothetical protein